MKKKNSDNRIPFLSGSLFLIFLPFLSAQSQPKKVLFLGNSYTSVNNLPLLVHDVALSAGDTLIYDSHTPGGYTLDEHYQDPNTIAKIQSEEWDYVVLQEQSQRPARYINCNVSLGFNLMREEVRKYNPCARTLLYMTWGHKNGDTQNCSSCPSVCTYEGMDSLTRKAYMIWGQITHSEISPAGALLHYIRENYPGLELYDTDGSHPSAAGSYAVACSFYTVIFKKNPSLISNDFSLPAADAAIIRSAAKAVVYDSLPSWDLKNYTAPTSQIYYTIENGTTNDAQFYSQTSYDSYAGPVNLQWSFGDGDTSSLLYPPHHYSGDGNFVISLTASVCDWDTLYKNTYYDTLSFCPFTPVITPGSQWFCPNIPLDTLFVSGSYDFFQWLMTEQGTFIEGKTDPYYLPSSPGTYSVLTTLNGCSERSENIHIMNAIQSPGFFNYFVYDNIPGEPPYTFCEGDSLTLIFSTYPNSDEQQIQWYKDGIPIAGSHSDLLTVKETGMYSVTLGDSAICPGYYHVPEWGDSVSCTFIPCASGVEPDFQRQEISLKTNPAIGFIEVVSPGKMNDIPYQLIDLTGKVCREGIMNVDKLISIAGLEGLYFLKLGFPQQVFFKVVVSED